MIRKDDAILELVNSLGRPIAQTEIARQLNISTQAMAPITARLVRQGKLIKVYRSPRLSPLIAPAHQSGE